MNVATRSGSNELHGSGFFFFRDHHLSAYPALHRDPFNPDPFFQRRQFGLALGGPHSQRPRFFLRQLRAHRAARGHQQRVLTPEFASLSGIYPSPTYVNQITAERTSILNRRIPVRCGTRTKTTFPLRQFGALYPSAWARQTGWADQSILGLTSQLGPRLGQRSALFLFFRQFRPACAGDCGLSDLPGNRRALDQRGRPVLHWEFQHQRCPWAALSPK